MLVLAVFECTVLLVENPLLLVVRNMVNRRWKGDIISFTRKKDTIRKDFDKKAFEKDYPDLYKKYLKEIPVVGSVTLKTI